MMTAIPAGFKLTGIKSSMKRGHAVLQVTYTNKEGEDRYIQAELFQEWDSPKVLVETLSRFASNLGRHMVEYEEPKKGIS